MRRTRTDYAINRYYSPDTGRFTTHDPLTELDRPERLNQPQGLNLYPYVMGGPTRYTDPDGLDWMVKGDQEGSYRIKWFDNLVEGESSGYRQITYSNSDFGPFDGYFESGEYYEKYAGRRIYCIDPRRRNFTDAFDFFGERIGGQTDDGSLVIFSEPAGGAEPDYIGPNGDGHGPLKVPLSWLSQKKGARGTLYGVRPAWIIGLGVYDARTGLRIGVVGEEPVEEVDGPYVLLGAGGIVKTTGKGVLRATRGPLHHLATNKNFISTVRGGPWSPRFKEMFERAGMTLDDALNKVRVPGHVGPHPEAYHEAVFKRLSTATEGLADDAYSAALRAELEAIGKEASTAGSPLNRLLTER